MVCRGLGGGKSNRVRLGLTLDKLEALPSGVRLYQLDELQVEQSCLALLV